MCYYCHRGIKMEHEKITQKFILLLEKSESLKMLVEKSLEVAKANNPDKITNPAQTLDELYEFLDWSVKCMPWECLKEAKYKNLFTAVDQTTGYFWFIFDQPLDELKDKGFYYPSLQYLEPIASWIKEVVKSWGKFLSTKQSWKEEFYQLALSDEKFGLKKGWYGDKNIWKTYNDFFSRKLIDRLQRPISDADVISPADSEPKGFYRIDEDNKLVNEVNIKSANLNSIEELLGKNCKYKKAFKGGTLTHTYLGMHDYHRYHFPIGGKILELTKIPGLNAGGGITEWDKKLKKYIYHNETGFQMIETRSCVILETEKFGLVAVLPVGMSQVCSCNWEKNLKINKVIEKGDPMGYFLLGGSDIIMIFQKHVKVIPLLKKANGKFCHLLMGEPYAKLIVEEN